MNWSCDVLGGGGVEAEVEVTMPPALQLKEEPSLRDSTVSSISRGSEVTRQSPEPHPVPRPSPNFGWKEMQNHKFRAWFAEFEPVPSVQWPGGSHLGAQGSAAPPPRTFAPVAREVRRPLRNTEPVCHPAGAW
eukprot:symbB.v1.2.016155.t1/scaffold1224.1/size148762/8